MKIEEIYFAGGCLWGVQEFLRYVPGIIETEAGRANGSLHTTNGPYDGYSECVRTRFNSEVQSVTGLMNYFFEIIDPYSLNQQGGDVGKKYRTGVYSKSAEHLQQARSFISARSDSTKIVVEVLPLTIYVCSNSEHQDRLLRCPEDYCHIDKALLHKYK